MPRDWWNPKEGGEVVKTAKPANKKPRRPNGKKDRLQRRKDRIAAAKVESGYAPRLGAPHRDYTSGEAFYKSREWKELRLLALANCRSCQACGRRPPDVILHVDHVKPRYTHPHLSLALDNLQILCHECNEGKGAWCEADFRQHFKSI